LLDSLDTINFIWGIQILAFRFSGNLFEGARIWYFYVARGTWVTFSLSQRTPNSYSSISFCTCYVITNMVPGYGMNTSCLKAIKSAYSACKGFKTTRTKGMNKYLEAEKGANTYEASQESECCVKTTKERSIRSPVKLWQSGPKHIPLRWFKSAESTKRVLGQSSFTGNF